MTAETRSERTEASGPDALRGRLLCSTEAVSLVPSALLSGFRVAGSLPRPSALGRAAASLRGASLPWARPLRPTPPAPSLCRAPGSAFPLRAGVGFL